MPTPGESNPVICRDMLCALVNSHVPMAALLLARGASPSGKCVPAWAGILYIVEYVLVFLVPVTNSKSDKIKTYHVNPGIFADLPTF